MEKSTLQKRQLFRNIHHLHFPADRGAELVPAGVIMSSHLLFPSVQ